MGCLITMWDLKVKNEYVKSWLKSYNISMRIIWVNIKTNDCQIGSNNDV